MPRPRLRVLRPLDYAGRALTVGMVFEAENLQHAALLKTLGLVADVPAVTTLMDADDGSPVEAAAVPVRTRRTYRRRDLTAED